MRDTRFAVVVTVYRRPELLMRALLSLMNQTHRDWACTVVSDGEAPVAREMYREFVAEARDARLDRAVFFERDRKEGLWGNHLRRWALEHTSRPYCVILGHDCELLPHCLAEHARLIDGREGVLSIVGTHVWNTRVMGNPTALLPRPEYLGVWPTGADPRALKIADVDLTCMAFPSTRAVAAGCFCEADQARYAADYLAYERLVKAGVPVAVCRRPCAVHF